MSRKSLRSQHISKKVFTKLIENSQEDCHWKSTTSGRNVPALDPHNAKSLAGSSLGETRYWYDTMVDPKVQQLEPISQLCPTSPAGSLEGLNCIPYGCYNVMVRKGMGGNGERVAGQKKDKSNSCYTRFLHKGKNPTFSLSFSPQFFESLCPYTVIKV